MSKILELALKPIYLRLIRDGAKKVEYRDGTEYYVNKLVNIEAYHGMKPLDILDGLRNGEIELIPRDYTHILFHESGTQRTLMVEIREITYPAGHLSFQIRLGDVIKKEQ